MADLSVMSRLTRTFGHPEPTMFATPPALAALLPFDDPGTSSNTSGLPGLAQLREIVGALLTFGLVACVAALVVSAVVWGFGSNSGNILGGGSNARDLTDLITLIGDRDEVLTSVSRDHYGARSTSSSVRRVPVMDTSRVRTLPFGTGVLLLRTAPPVALELVAWPTRRKGPGPKFARCSTHVLMPGPHAVSRGSYRGCRGPA